MSVLQRLLIVSAFLLFSLSPYSAWAQNQSLRLITYNVWGLPVPIKFDHSKLPLIAKSIPYYNVDVAAFQETFTKRAQILKTIKDMNYFAEGPGKKGFKFQSSGLLTVSRHPIVATKSIEFNKCAGMDCFSNKGVLLTVVKMPDGSLVDIYNTHMNSGKNAKVKWSQVGQLVNFIKANDQGRPTFIAGDFNLTPDSPYHHFLTDESGLVDTHQSYVEAHPELSEKEKRGITHVMGKLFSKKTLERKLDYAFVLNPQHQSADIVSTRVVYDGSHDKNRFSDHFAVLLEYLLP